MKSHPIHAPLAPCSTSRVLVALVATVGFLVATSVRANQVYKACGKKWARQAAKLPPDQLAWLMEQRAAELDRDLDGDGLADHLIMTSTPSFRGCDVKGSWQKKETTLRIEYGDGRSQLFHWIGEHLVESLRLHPATGRILVAGVDVEGAKASRWVDYRHGEGPMPETMLAELPDEDAPVQVAGGLR